MRKMSGMIRKHVLFPCLFLSLAACMGSLAQAQQQPVTADVAITYVAERAKIASVDCGCFWLQGGSGDFALTFFHGLGAVVNLTGVHAGDIGTGLELDKVMFVAGPRYTYSPKGWPHVGKNHAVDVFGEGLFGTVHGFNTVFPSANGVMGAADSLAMMFGGGLDIRMKNHIGIRAVEADYVRTTLPNSTDNVQNDLRFAAGISFHFDSLK
jgi:hypothetical protein